MRFFREALRHICEMLERRELHLWPLLYRTSNEVLFSDSVEVSFQGTFGMNLLDYSSLVQDENVQKGTYKINLHVHV
jgi:hypothetical protein